MDRAFSPCPISEGVGSNNRQSTSGRKRDSKLLQLGKSSDWPGSPFSVTACGNESQFREDTPRLLLSGGGWVEGASLTTAEPPALRGLALSQRDKTHHRVPATFNRTPEKPQAGLAPACGAVSLLVVGVSQWPNIHGRLFTLVEDCKTGSLSRPQARESPLFTGMEQASLFTFSNSSPMPSLHQT